MPWTSRETAPANLPGYTQGQIVSGAQYRVRGLDFEVAGKLRGSPADGVGNHWWYQLTAADFQACQLSIFNIIFNKYINNNPDIHL